MPVTLVIPTINQTQMIDDCLTSFFKFHKDEHEIIVVDDGSPPDTQKAVQAICEKHGADFLSNSFNVGFSNTVNRGIDRATNDIVILVNNDIVFTEEITSKFESSFKNDERIGIVGGLLFYPNGTIQHGGIFRTESWFMHRAWHKTLKDSPVVKQDCYIIAVTGALFGIRKAMSDKIGVMNPTYFIACEDTEMCLRAWKNGWRVFYNGSIQAIHAEGATRGHNNEVKMKKGRDWMIKEKETNRRFAQDMKRFDFKVIESRIKDANSNISRVKLAKLDQGCGVVGVNRAGALGDVLLTTGLIRKLKKKFPNYDIHVATGCGAVFKNNPNISRLVRSRDQLVGNIIFDLDLVYEKSPKMPIVEAYHRSVFGDGDLVSDTQPEMFPDENDEKSLMEKLPPRFLIPPVAVVHMGVGWPNRTWQRQKWLRVIDHLVSKDVRIAVVGKAGDFKPETKNNVLNLTNKLSIHEIMILIQKSNVFIGMDTGLLHIASCTDTPLVGLFTCANPIYRLVERKAQSVALIPKVSCRFCLHEEEPPVTFAGCKRGNYQCLNDITVADVIKSANKFLF